MLGGADNFSKHFGNGSDISFMRSLVFPREHFECLDFLDVQIQSWLNDQLASGWTLVEVHEIRHPVTPNKARHACAQALELAGLRPSGPAGPGEPSAT